MTPNQLTAAALVIQYWVDRDTVNPGVFIAVFLVVIIAINYLGIKFFGEFEFWLSSIKVLSIVGLILMSLVIALGGGPDHDRRGFRYWRDPGAFKELYAKGDAGRFIGLWASFVTAVFAFLGTELVGVTVGEAQNPRKVIPSAIKLTFWRILFFYILSVLLIGMIVPYNSKGLVFASKQTNPGASASPFVVAVGEAGIKSLPGFMYVNSFLPLLSLPSTHPILPSPSLPLHPLKPATNPFHSNALILIFVFSACNSDLYIATRTLYGLAKEGNAHRIFARTDKRGLPVYSLALCSLIACIAFLNVADDSKKVFTYFVNLVTIFGLLTWISILVTHIYFVKARRAQNIPDSALPYTAPLGLWGTYFALAFCIIVSIFKNFEVFVHDPKRDPGLQTFDYKNFITGYLGIPLYLGLIAGYKVVKRSKAWGPLAADFYTGKDVIDREEGEYLEKKAAKMAGKGEGRAGWFYRKFVSWLF